VSPEMSSFFIPSNKFIRGASPKISSETPQTVGEAPQKVIMNSSINHSLMTRTLQVRAIPKRYESILEGQSKK
jgi:hypothetical protein